MSDSIFDVTVFLSVLPHSLIHTPVWAFILAVTVFLSVEPFALVRSLSLYACVVQDTAARWTASGVSVSGASV